MTTTYANPAERSYTHKIENGFCTECGETEEWLIANGWTPKSAEIGLYAAETQFHDRTRIWSGVTRKAGNKRRTDVCAHGHKTEAAAMKCAEHLRDLRNAR